MQASIGRRLPRDLKGWALSCIAGVIFLLFLVSLFKNISYPLFWADESMTVMGGVRVLQYGYPKVHDDKNVFYDLQHSDVNLGVSERTDAYIGGANWGQYYIAAIGVKLGQLTDDIYFKTRIIRTIFALFGLAGVLLFALLGARLFQAGNARKTFFAIFLFVELLSIPLTLHLREARYYALTVFLAAIVISANTGYRILREVRYRRYWIVTVTFMFLLFLTFSPAYFALLAAALVFETMALVTYFLRPTVLPDNREKDQVSSPIVKRIKDYLLNLLPYLISLTAVSPFLVFFDTFRISQKLAEYYAWGFQTTAEGLYLRNLFFIWDYFTSDDLIYLALLLKLLMIVCLLPRLFRKKSLNASVSKVLMFSSYLSTVFVVYFFLIPQVPNPLFTRYFIVLQPILAMIIIVDSFVILQATAEFRNTALRYAGYATVLSVCLTGVLVNISANQEFLEGHIFELTHQYRGPLDYLIPFIREHYGRTDNLSVATNYEESSYMYYLNAKVTVGYVGNNIDEDSRIQPDVIVYRKAWSNFRRVFADFIALHPYEEISFPVEDYLVNNIPELHRQPPFRHLFRTRESSDEWMKTYIFLKK